MGCVCCSISSFVSILLNALERISLCTVCAMLTCCMLFTIVTVMVMGIGIGFHYCSVQNSVEEMAKSPSSETLRSGSGVAGNRGHVMRSVDQATVRGFAHRLGRRDVGSPPPTNDEDTVPQTFTLTNTFNATMDQIANITFFMSINSTNFTSY